MARSKKGNLAAALTGFDRQASDSMPDPEDTKSVPADSLPTALPPSRQGKKALTGYFNPEVIKQLKVLAATEDTTMQSLMNEAINELFKKYGKPHIA